ncbi:MAG: methane monooxygenase/ammonia monooxygenase subunit A [Pseudomonadota bacterium]|nr:methane monooxygenase/ammonia monooxygenase subunit A [Pseudomonadota bacterium]
MGIRLGPTDAPAGAVIQDTAVSNAREQWEAWKNIDYIVYPFFMIILGGVFVFVIALTAGDWDYWQDWRDRRWWPLVTPMLIMTLPCVLTYFFWKNFKLPVAFTTVAVGFFISTMLSRYVNFYVFTAFPFNFVMPATWIGAAVAIDAVLMITRSFAVTGLVGGFLWGVLFYTLNWPGIAPMQVPIELHGMVITLADYMGFTYVRTAMPEYVRIIEAGTLRTFGDSVAPVTVAMAGFVCILIYYVFVWVGSKAARPLWLQKVI